MKYNDKNRFTCPTADIVFTHDFLGACDDEILYERKRQSYYSANF